MSVSPAKFQQKGYFVLLIQNQMNLTLFTILERYHYGRFSCVGEKFIAKKMDNNKKKKKAKRVEDKILGWGNFVFYRLFL